MPEILSAFQSIGAMTPISGAGLSGTEIIIPLPIGYDLFQLYMWDVRMSEDGDILAARFSEDGSTFPTTTRYAFMEVAHGVPTGTWNEDVGNRIFLPFQGGLFEETPAELNMQIYPGGVAKFASADYRLRTINALAEPDISIWDGSTMLYGVNGDGRQTAIKIFSGFSNFTTGNYRLFGIPSE